MVIMSWGHAIPLAVAVALSALSMSAYSQVYKCKDSTGKTLYSGQPCEFGGKPLPLSDNTVQAHRPPANAEGEPTTDSGNSSSSANCGQMPQVVPRSEQPRGIVDARNYRQSVKQQQREYQANCGGGTSGTATGARNASAQGPKNDDAGLSRCPDGSTVSGSQGCWQCPDGSYVSAMSKSCQRAPDGRNVDGGRKISQCPDGSFVGGTCFLGPDGKYIGK